jgi:hypothetical protein
MSSRGSRDIHRRRAHSRSASVSLDCTEGNTTRRLFSPGTSADPGFPIIRDPEPPDGADVVVMEVDVRESNARIDRGRRTRALARVIRETAATRWPCPDSRICGRPNAGAGVRSPRARRRRARFPRIPIYIDSPLRIDTTSGVRDASRTCSITARTWCRTSGPVSDSTSCTTRGRRGVERRSRRRTARW